MTMEKAKMRMWFAACAAVCLIASGRAEEDRWVFLPCSFWGKGTNVHSLAYCTNVAARAKKAGYNGALLSCHLDLSYKWPPNLTRKVKAAKEFCDAIGLEVIPMSWDIGYGGDCDGNWFESCPINDLSYERRGDKAVFTPASVEIRGGPTENFSAEAAPGAKMPMRLARKFTLQEGVRYVLTMRARSIGVPEKDRMYMIGFLPGRKTSAYSGGPKYANDGEWHDAVFPLEGKSDKEVTFVFGHWGNTGRLEVASFEIRERGICGATRREGIPFTVKDAKSGFIYKEGRDYADVPPINVRHEGDPSGPYLVLDIPKGSRIPDGGKLLVSAEIPYKFRSRRRDQYSACMSIPELYERMEKGARAVNELLRPKKWFFCFDELRSANACALCRSRNLDMAHLIGDCLTRQREIVRRISPSIVCYVWGDMLDPNHNANEGYAHTHGSYEGIAQCIPKDLVICPWWAKKATQMTDYWAANGFRCLAGAYYDEKPEKDNAGVWRAEMRKHPGMFTGWMYATWIYDFSKLEWFMQEMLKK